MLLYLRADLVKKEGGGGTGRNEVKKAPYFLLAESGAHGNSP